MRRHIDPHFFAAHVHGEGTHVIGPLVKGATAGDIEAGIMPVTGEDAAIDRAFVERKAHVWAAIIDRVSALVVIEERNGVAFDLNRKIAFVLEIGQAGGAYEMSRCAGCHHFLLVCTVDVSSLMKVTE